MPGELPFDNLLAVLFGFAFLPLVLFLSGRLGLYTVIREREAQVYTLFGKVLGTLEEPGIRFPLLHFGLKALLVPLFGEMHRVDTRLRQNYLRDQMVNSGEGTPMGVGIWYEMQVNDSVAYLFANANPEGSLEANVSSATTLPRGTQRSMSWSTGWPGRYAKPTRSKRISRWSPGNARAPARSRTSMGASRNSKTRSAPARPGCTIAGSLERYFTGA